MNSASVGSAGASSTSESRAPRGDELAQGRSAAGLASLVAVPHPAPGGLDAPERRAAGTQPAVEPRLPAEADNVRRPERAGVVERGVQRRHGARLPERRRKAPRASVRIAGRLTPP